jgi:hypothetical protein
MEINVLEALKIHDELNLEAQRLNSYIEKEPEGNLKNELLAIAAKTKELIVSIQKETESALVKIPESADKYIKRK